MRFRHIFLQGFLLLGLLLLPLFSHAQIENVRIGGFGELHYNNVIINENGPETPGELDFQRFAIYLGYDFNDKITFRSELELRNTSVEGSQGSIALQQAYVDYEINRYIGIRAGLLLVPAGIINPMHDPPSFNGVERPNVERFIIPTTWRESGIGIYGQLEERISYEVYVMAGLDADGISGTEGIRNARQEGIESSTDNIAATARLLYKPIPGLRFSGSYFFSDLQSDFEFGNSLEGVFLNMVEGHVVYSKGGFESRLLGVYALITEADRLNALFGNNVGETQYGAYLELAYDVLRFTRTDTEQRLNVFARGEIYDTQFTTIDITENPENERYEYTFGLTYKPTGRVAFKADYQLLQSAGVRDIQQLNVGVGYSF